MNHENNYNCIDLFKIIAAIIVVAIHTDPTRNCSELIKTIFSIISDLAVPFFFIASGFFFGKQLNGTSFLEGKIRIIEMLKKYTQLYIWWSIAYLPLAVYGYKLNKQSCIGAIFDYIRGFLFRGEHYNSWPLWYLLASIYAYLFLLFLYMLFIGKLSILRLVVFALLAFYISVGVTALSTSYNCINGILYYIAVGLKYAFGTGRIFSGCCYILCGLIIQKFNLKWFSGMFFLVIGMMFRLFNQSLLSELGLVIMSLGLFILLLNIKLKGENIWLKCRNLSKWIYFLHMYVFSIVCLFYGYTKYGVVVFFITIVLTLILSLIIEKYKTNFRKKQEERN